MRACGCLKPLERCAFTPDTEGVGWRLRADLALKRFEQLVCFGDHRIDRDIEQFVQFIRRT